VLKAHIALAQAFPDGIASPLIDAICRAPLWQAQMDYGHGTGHGVGYFLNVTKGHAIAYSASTPKERRREGMISGRNELDYTAKENGASVSKTLMVNIMQAANPTETGLW
jgi:Xaa-Pro aminopeptidase